VGGVPLSEAAQEQLPVRPWGWVDVLALVALVLLSGALVCSSLSRRDLWHPDETRFSVIARTMHQTGNYLVPHLGATLYEEKPPLVFWLMDLSAALTGGFSDVAMKLPSAAASVLLAVAFYLIARLFFGELTSFLAVVVLQDRKSTRLNSSH
jgi:4-amino-4-deoxy-L-arabinose transferase-like glycosyltransferase